MANVQFRLNKGKKIDDINKAYPIYMRYVVGRNVDFNASMKINVLPSDWDESKQKVKNKVHILNRHELNEKLKNIKRHLEDFDASNKAKGIVPSYADVKAHYNVFYSQPSKNQTHDFMEYVDTFIKDARSTQNHSTGKVVTKGTIATYERSKKVLLKFASQHQTTFNSINLEWYNQFISFCHSQDYSVNYTGQQIKFVKNVLNKAHDIGLTNNTVFKGSRFRVTKESTKSIYLTTGELTRMFELDLSKDKRKERARDLFIIGAFTGLRVSDYNNLSESNLILHEGVRMFKVTTKKTGQTVTIPIHPWVQQILERYKNNPPQRLNDQTINKLIKEVAESCGIDEVEYITTSKGGKSSKEKRYRFDLVMTHTARRSFCTNAYLNGVGTIDIMAISGHKTESAFMRYINVTADQVAVRLAKHDFFNVTKE